MASPVVGILLMTAITILVVAIILMQLLTFNFGWGDPKIPAIFKIIKITYGKNLDRVMVVQNTGPIDYKNKDLYAMTYRNGIQLNCIISTLNGHDFISSHHIGTQNMKGTSGTSWYHDQTVSINYKDRTFHPGDQIMFEVYDTATNQIISRDTFPHAKKGTMMYNGLFAIPQSSSRLKTPFFALRILHSGHRQESGTSFHAVPTGIPFRGSPFSGS